MDRRTMRRKFRQGMFIGLHIVWPVLSAVLVLIIVLGIIVGQREGWSIQESLYFSFVTGLTIGYGDFAPKTHFGRMLAILIGMCGIILTALVAAVAVKAITVAHDASNE